MSDQPRPPQQPEEPEPSAYPPPPPAQPDPATAQPDPAAAQPDPATTQPDPASAHQPPAQYQGYPAEAAAAESRQPGWAPPTTGALGKIRGTGICILLFIVTLGIYGIYWYYAVHKEMKDHTNRGIGGGIALILAIFVGIVMPYLTSSEVGELYSGRGEEKPVSGTTGLWYFPGMLILVGPIIWFVKTNGALNDYWARNGVQA